MNFKDRWATDEEGNKFVFTVEMQKQLSERGLEVTPESLKELGNRPQKMPAPKVPVPEVEEQFETVARSERRDAELDPPLTIQIDPETGKYIGRLKWYNAKKGYGFILRGGGEEIFFHKSGLIGNPDEFSEGLWILYDLEETHKGPEAAEIEPYSGDVEQLS